MTPKEKAEQLYNKMIVDLTIDKWQSKQCALIAVDEILKFLASADVAKYWQEVKKEIEKL